jgi:hypothetical protein
VHSSFLDLSTMGGQLDLGMAYATSAGARRSNLIAANEATSVCTQLIPPNLAMHYSSAAYSEALIVSS